jgi:hypothetical protein
MKSPAAAHPKKDRPRHGKKKPPQKHRTEPGNPHYTLDDLKAKFNKR